MYICLDIGGTSIKVAICEKNTDIIEKDTLETKQDIGEFIKIIFDYIEYAMNKYDIDGIAISSPGAVDSKVGIIGGASAIPCIHGPNWKKIIGERFNVNVSIENDANCVALAEVFSGTAKDLDDILFVVCGTGIGGSIIKDKKVHHGKNLHGGEFGFMIMEETDGEYRTFSDVASTMSFVRKARKHYLDDSIDGKKVFDMAEKGDEFCVQILEKFYSELAKGIYNLQYIYDPEIILLGGSISDRLDFIDNINRHIDKIMDAIEIANVRPSISYCTHRKDANIIGALAHHLNEYS